MKTKILLTISIIFNIIFLVTLTLFIIYKDLFSLLMFRTSVKTVCTYELEGQKKDKDFCKLFTQ